VVITDEEIDKVKLKTTNTIEVKEFIDSDEFDPIFIEKNYYIGPDAGKKKSDIGKNSHKCNTSNSA
jgi:DNA end-binding protein Ku